jgi:AcrR family transcriptional regulator
VPPKRRMDDVRRPQILAAAVELLTEEGMSTVRVADVAERAETSATSVIYYFGTKADLFEQAIAQADDAYYADLLSHVGQLDSGMDRLAWLFVSSSTMDWLLWMDLWVYTRRHPDLLEAHQRFDRRFREVIADAIRHGQERGEFAPADAGEVSVRIGSLMRGLAVHVALGEHDVTAEQMIGHCLHTAAQELRCDLADLQAAADRVGERRAA